MPAGLRGCPAIAGRDACSQSSVRVDCSTRSQTLFGNARRAETLFHGGHIHGSQRITGDEPLVRRRVSPVFRRGNHAAPHRVQMQVFQLLQHHRVTHQALRMESLLPYLMLAGGLVPCTQPCKPFHQPLAPLRRELFQQPPCSELLQVTKHARQVRGADDGVKMISMMTHAWIFSPLCVRQYSKDSTRMSQHAAVVNTGSQPTIVEVTKYRPSGSRALYRLRMLVCPLLETEFPGQVRSQTESGNESKLVQTCCTITGSPSRWFSSRTLRAARRNARRAGAMKSSARCLRPFFMAGAYASMPQRCKWPSRIGVRVDLRRCSRLPSGRPATRSHGRSAVVLG